ncbi:hypothetical protein [Williamsia sp.]|uniref:hypothetical protein n=1 Tax=Williamsia sp. TaxID=1872085 RepID=UPI001A30A4DD|nr:hypothetical protein [Williamsia sp.]MBJ7290272.1 hypothetical protein [Williamsia sp.]
MQSVSDWCSSGVAAERAGDRENAHQAFERAWSSASTAHERAVSAHHLARVSTTAAARLEWDRTALASAAEADPNDVESLVPTLHLALAASLRRIGDNDGARAALTAATDAATTNANVSPAVVAAIVDGVAALEPRDPVIDTISTIGSARRFAAVAVLVQGYLASRVAGSPTALRDAVDTASVAGLISADEAAAITSGAAGPDVALGL